MAWRIAPLNSISDIKDNKAGNTGEEGYLSFELFRTNGLSKKPHNVDSQTTRLCRPQFDGDDVQF